MSSPIIPDLLLLLVNSVGRAALGATLVTGLGEKWVAVLEDYVNRNGKFSKFAVAYSPIAPPPVFWEYNCGSCRAFQKEQQRCRWVSEEGFPQPQEIHPAAWCAIFMPLEGERPLTWVGRTPWFIREPMPKFP